MLQPASPETIAHFRKTFLNDYQAHQRQSVELAKKNDVTEMDAVVQAFIVFMQDEAKWQKIMRMYQYNEEIEIKMRSFVCAINASFKALPVLKQLMVTNELIAQAFSDAHSPDKEAPNLQKDHLHKMLIQLQGFLTFVEENLTGDTEQLSQVVKQASERATQVQAIKELLAPYPKEMAPFARLFEKYSQEQWWLQLHHQVPSQIDVWLEEVRATISQLAGEKSKSQDYVFNSVSFQLLRLFQNLAWVTLPDVEP